MEPSQENNARPDPVVIIGAGHAGGTAAAQLRQYGWTGPVMLVGNESCLPYQRPPLSKEWLLDDMTLEDLLLRKNGFYEKADIHLFEAQALAIDAKSRLVTLDDGTSVRYEKLILATGSRPRVLSLPGSTADNILQLRDHKHATALKQAMAGARNLVVVGGGYIGLEVASTASMRGVNVTVIEAEARLLARVASPELSQFFLGLHERAGVKIELGAQVVEFVEEKGKVRGVTLKDGRTIPCDVALVGVGGIANDELAREAGLACENGIVVDLDTKSSDPFIFAIGDCTYRPLTHYDVRHRLESVPNALEQAKQAAAAICGKPRPNPEVPWFWSTQYKLKLQIAGLPFHVVKRIVRSYDDSERFVVFHLNEKDRLQAVEAMNAPVDFVKGRQFIETRVRLNPAALGDISIPVADTTADDSGLQAAVG